jgi:hypothetical protein
MWLVDEPMTWIIFFIGVAFVLFFGPGDKP